MIQGLCKQERYNVVSDTAKVYLKHYFAKVFLSVQAMSNALSSGNMGRDL